MKLSKKILLLFILLFSVVLILSNKSFEAGLKKLLPNLNVSPNTSIPGSTENVRILNEESHIVDIVDKVSPSVVTVGISTTRSTGRVFELDPFSGYRLRPGEPQEVKQDIGSGFIISQDGMIVTNKHVVSETGATYRVITNDDKEFEVKKIYRDPSNDLAILKIEASGLTPVELGDSSKLKVGQFALAIGTALGEFRHTVTTGVISGLGRGITAGSPFESFAEKLDNVIQTDAAINPGNSGGPLLNSAGQVIGVNTAVASDGQNIGFALPINLVKEALDTFNTTGQFARPYLGIRYQTISRDAALLNEVPEGALVREVVADSPAEKAGLQVGDIFTKIDNTRIAGADGEVAAIIGKKKVGDTVIVTYWRDSKEATVTVTLQENTQ